MRPELRSLYARHLLLPEISEEGQDALCSSVLGGLEGDPRAAAVARLYLERAGVRFEDEGAPLGRVPDAGDVESLAGRPELVEAAAFLAGAVAAVEHIKAVVGAGDTALQAELSLTGPRDPA